mgnify:FL=1
MFQELQQKGKPIPAALTTHKPAAFYTEEKLSHK